MTMDGPGNLAIDEDGSLWVTESQIWNFVFGTAPTLPFDLVSQAL